MKRRLITVAVTATTMALLAGCGGGGSAGGGSDQEPYRVLVTGGLSAQGVLAANAATAVLATQAGVEDVNAKGGIGGRRVELTVVDDAGDATQAVTKLREAIASDAKPDLFLNSGPSTISTATLPILTQNQILSFNIAPTKDSADPARFPLNFDLSPSPQDQIKGFVAEAKQRGYTSIGVIHGSSAYGETFGPAVESAMSEAGITVVGNEEYDVAALDMTPQLQALQSRQPQAVVVDGYGAPVGYLLQSMERLGWDVPLLGNVSVAATSLVSTDPPAGVLGTPQAANLTMEVYQSTSHDPGAARVNEMVATMRRLGEIQAALIVAYNYDGLFLAAAAAQDAGSTDAEAMARSMVKPQVQQAANTAVLNRYNFSDTSHSPNADPGNFLFISPSRIQDGQFGNGAGA